MSQKKYEITEITHPRGFIGSVPDARLMSRSVPERLEDMFRRKIICPRMGPAGSIIRQSAVKKPWLKMTAGCLMAPWHGEAH